MTSKRDAIRLCVQQPALPKYRVPVFRELARRPDIALQLHYASASDVPSCAADGFNSSVREMRQLRIGGTSLYWHPPQWTCATSRSCDVLILSWDTHYASLVPGLLRARAAGVATILWGHGYSKRESVIRKSWRYAVGRLATAVLVYDHATAARLIAAGWDSSRVYVAQNSLDQEPISNAREHWLSRPDELRLFRDANGLARGPVVLFVSRLCADNQLELLLRAAERLKARHPKLKVVLIGGGEEEARLRNLAQALRLSDCIVFPGPIYDELKLAPWFLSADVFCYPVNMGLSILHAFGYGLPVVTSSLTSRHGPEIAALEPGRNGQVFRHGCESALADALAEIIDDRTLRSRLSEGALATVRDQFSIKAMVDGMEAATRFAYAATH